MLLTVRESDEVVMLLTGEGNRMGEYLHAVRNNITLFDLQEMACWGDEVEEEEQEQVAAEWAGAVVIADERGEYRDRADEAGKRALQVAGLYKAPLAELDTCATAEKVRDMVEEYEAIIIPDNDYEQHEFTWQVCRLIYDKSARSTLPEVAAMVSLWDDVCSRLIGGHVGLSAFKYSNELEECEFERVNVVQMSCENVNLQSRRPYDLAYNMAHFVDGELLALYDSEQDGEQIWYYFNVLGA